MMKFRFGVLIVSLISLFTVSCDDQSPTPVAEAKNAALETFNGLPGPRTCFWSRGPVSKDPYMNIAYPDAGVFYWAAMFTIPEGAQLQLEGEFPHSRYMSLISYDGRGAPVESIADYLIQPDDGATNPFVSGNDRKSQNRKFTLEILNAPSPRSRQEGIRLADPNQLEGASLEKQLSNTLHAPSYANGQQSILYRIYVPDKGKSETGGVPMPEPVLTLSSGEVLRGADACNALNASQPLLITPNAVGVPMNKYRELTNQLDKPDTWPATVPPTWFLQYDRKFLLGIYNGDLPESARKSTGGFYPNLDNNYVRTIINRKHGPIFVLRGKLPSTPKTWNSAEKMSAGDLVYWSICSNQGFANTRVNDCLFDEQVPIDKNGMYTIVVSRHEDRPRNARIECGIGWLPMADDGDGAGDEDVTVVQIRNMLASPDFKEAIQKVVDIGTEKEIMGPYLPNSFYTTKGAFEVFFPCLL